MTTFTKPRAAKARAETKLSGAKQGRLSRRANMKIGDHLVNNNNNNNFNNNKSLCIATIFRGGHTKEVTNGE